MLPPVAKNLTAKNSVASLKRGAIASILALALALPAPAMAWGQREQDTLKGILGTLVIGGLILNSQNQPRVVQPQPAPVYHAPPRQEPRYYQEPRHYQEPRGHGRPRHEAPRYYAPQVSIYATPAARAFNSYSNAERRLIQRRLAAYGYYRGGVDGSFGPGTYSAVVAYANAQRLTRQLASTSSAYGVYDGLIY